MGSERLPTRCIPTERSTWFSKQQPATLVTAPQSLQSDFMDTIRGGDTWERHLFHGIHLLTTVEELLAHLREGVIIASDGSAPAGKASFGWIISSKQGKRLVMCDGPAFGYDSSSF